MDIKKVIARLPVGYVEDTAGMNGDQLRAEIIKAEASLREVDKELKADEKLQGAKELLKDLSGAYSDAKKAQRAKIAYTLHMLDERGELGEIEFNPDGDATTKESRPAPARADSRPAKKTRAA